MEIQQREINPNKMLLQTNTILEYLGFPPLEPLDKEAYESYKHNIINKIEDDEFIEGIVFEDKQALVYDNETKTIYRRKINKNGDKKYFKVKLIKIYNDIYIATTISTYRIRVKLRDFLYNLDIEYSEELVNELIDIHTEGDLK